MPLELGNVAPVSFAYDTFVASHAGYIDSGTAGADWFKSFFLQFAPTLVGEFNPLVGDKDVFCNFREHSEHLNSEKVVWTIQSSLEFEITLSFIEVLLTYGRCPTFHFVFHPLVVHLSGYDDLFFHYVFGVQRIEPEFGESF